MLVQKPTPLGIKIAFPWALQQAGVMVGGAALQPHTLATTFARAIGLSEDPAVREFLSPSGHEAR